MPHASLAASLPSPASRAPSAPGYRPGACNIGPAEIARRRRTGHAGLLATLVVLALLIAIHAPGPTRLILVVPAMVGAAGYLQAWLRFCAAYGSLGVFNFGEVGRTRPVEEPAARRRDGVRALEIGAASLLVGVAVAAAAFLAPI